MGAAGNAPLWRVGDFWMPQKETQTRIWVFVFSKRNQDGQSQKPPCLRQDLASNKLTISEHFYGMTGKERKIPGDGGIVLAKAIRKSNLIVATGARFLNLPTQCLHGFQKAKSPTGKAGLSA